MRVPFLSKAEEKSVRPTDSSDSLPDTKESGMGREDSKARKPLVQKMGGEVAAKGSSTMLPSITSVVNSPAPTERSANFKAYHEQDRKSSTDDDHPKLERAASRLRRPDANNSSSESLALNGENTVKRRPSRNMAKLSIDGEPTDSTRERRPSNVRPVEPSSPSTLLPSISSAIKRESAAGQRRPSLDMDVAKGDNLSIQEDRRRRPSNSALAPLENTEGGLAPLQPGHGSSNASITRRATMSKSPSSNSFQSPGSSPDLNNRRSKDSEILAKMAIKKQEFLARKATETGSRDDVKTSMDNILSHDFSLKRVITMIDPNRTIQKSLREQENRKDSEEQHGSLLDLDKIRKSSNNPIKRWAQIYRLQKIFSYLLILYRKCSLSVEQYRSSLKAKEGTAFNFLTKFHEKKVDHLLSRRVIDLLTGTVKTKKEMDTLEKLLKMRLRSFAAYTPEQRARFCSIMIYEKHEPGKVIIREGDVANAFYFVMSGQLEIFKNVGGERCPLNVLSSGDSFGDRTMQKLGDKRTASVQVLVPAEILSIDKREFVTITKMGDEELQARRIALIESLSTFKTAAKGIAQRILPFCRFQTFEAQHPILLEGSHMFQIYWILSGSCRTIKVVPFHKKLVNHTLQFGDAFALYPFTEGETELGPSDEIARELLSIHEIAAGAHFPNMPKAPGYLEFDQDAFKMDDYIQMIRHQETTGKTDICQVSIMTNERVDVMYMSRLEFVEIVPKSVLLDCMREDYITDSTISELQTAFLEKRQWELHKHKVTKEVVSNK